MALNATADLAEKPLAATSTVTVGELLVRMLEHWGVQRAFGVISIHNMPILDAMAARGGVEYLPARGEAGAVNMADAYARVAGHLGVAFTSTGTGAGNAAGALVEALTAGSPVLHVTGQIELQYLGRDRGYIHEAPAQLEMLKAVSKAAFTLTDPAEAVALFHKAATLALTAPTGPVSIEIPIDIQKAPVPMPAALPDLDLVTPAPSPALVARLADTIRQARRPVLLLGGGARLSTVEALKLADLGLCIITSTNGRGIVPEVHPMSLGAFNCTPDIQAFYRTCDLIIIAGSRMRGNETWTYKLELPPRVAMIDVNPKANQRSYPPELFVEGDCKKTLAALLDALPPRLDLDPAFAADVAKVREDSRVRMQGSLGPYDQLVADIQAVMPAQAAWVRDVTISNSMWGNRYLKVGSERLGVHAVGGGIGQGLPMAIGAALAAPDGAVVLSGDGGLTLCLGELATAAEIDAPMTLVLMNDAGYGVIRNIQDAEYGGRRCYADIKVPDFALVAASLGIPHEMVRDLAGFRPALERALALGRPAIVEVDMVEIGPYPEAFAGPPKKTTA